MHLLKNPVHERKLINIFAAFGASMIVVAIGHFLYKTITPPDPWSFLFGDDNSQHTLRQWVYALFTGSILAPMVEEAVFRHAPFQIIKKLGVFEKIKIPMVILTSVIFGCMHGGEMHMLTQGMGGFILAWVYLENDCSYWSSVTVHCMWNTVLTLGWLTI